MHMRWRLLLCAIAALASAPVTSSAPRVPAPVPASSIAPVPPAVPVITIHDLGYGASYSMAGSTARADFTFPLPSYGMTAGELTLVTNPSPSLRGNSLIRVFADDALITTTSVTALRQNGNWTLKLPAARHRYLRIRLESALFVENGGACNDENATLWIAIDGRSALRYAPAPGVQSIDDFFRLPGGRFLLDADWQRQPPLKRRRSPFMRPRAVRLAAIRQSWRSGPWLPLLLRPASNATSSCRRMASRSIAKATPYVDAGSAALQSLTREASRTARLAGSLAAAVADLEQQSPRTCGTNRLCLQDLGLGDQNVSGVGSLVTSFGFTLAQFGGWPDNLAFDLDAAFDAVATTTLERAMLRVRLNGALVHTEDIRGQSTLHTSIPLATPLVNVANRLGTELTARSAIPPAP